MGLDEDAVDLFENHGAGLLADGFNEGACGWRPYRADLVYVGRVPRALLWAIEFTRLWRAGTVADLIPIVESFQDSFLHTAL